MIAQLDVVEDSEIDALSARLSGARADLLFVNAGIIHDKKETAETISPATSSHGFHADQCA